MSYLNFQKKFKFCEILQHLQNLGEILELMFFFQNFPEFSILNQFFFGKMLRIQLAHFVDLEKM